MHIFWFSYFFFVLWLFWSLLSDEIYFETCADKQNIRVLPTVNVLGQDNVNAIVRINVELYIIWLENDLCTQNRKPNIFKKFNFTVIDLQLKYMFCNKIYFCMTLLQDFTSDLRKINFLSYTKHFSIKYICLIFMNEWKTSWDLYWIILYISFRWY